MKNISLNRKWNERRESSNKSSKKYMKMIVKQGLEEEWDQLHQVQC